MKTQVLSFKTLKRLLKNTNTKMRVQLNLFSSDGSCHTNYFFKASLEKDCVLLHNLPTHLNPPFAYTPYHQQSANTYKLFKNTYNNSFQLQVKFS